MLKYNRFSLVAFIYIATVLLSLSEAKNPNGYKNVLFIIADDLGDY